jgi:phosphoglycolate phosphatase
MQTPDSLIFDMDGTLWDAVDTYTNSWNMIFRQMNIDKHVKRDELAKMIGWEGKKVLAALMPEFEPERQNEIYAEVNLLRRTLLAQNGGILYDGVREGLKQLAEKYKLFILSNCAIGVIRIFMEWAGINPYITDEIAYGTNYMPKNHNIQLLINNHNLKNPVYIGDTAGDGEQSRLAGVPYVFVSYGFGQTDEYDLKFDQFNELTAYFLNLR